MSIPSDSPRDILTRILLSCRKSLPTTSCCSACAIRNPVHSSMLPIQDHRPPHSLPLDQIYVSIFPGIASTNMVALSKSRHRSQIAGAMTWSRFSSGVATRSNTRSSKGGFAFATSSSGRTCRCSGHRGRAYPPGSSMGRLSSRCVQSVPTRSPRPYKSHPVISAHMGRRYILVIPKAWASPISRSLTGVNRSH